jgi:hypothetical protein
MMEGLPRDKAKAQRDDGRWFEIYYCPVTDRAGAVQFGPHRVDDSCECKTPGLPVVPNSGVYKITLPSLLPIDAKQTTDRRAAKLARRYR